MATPLARNLFSFAVETATGASPDVISVSGSLRGHLQEEFVLALAQSIRRQGKRCLLIAARDGSERVLNKRLGLQPSHNLTEVITHGLDFKDILISGPLGIDILPLNSEITDLMTLEKAAFNQLALLFAPISSRYDAIIIDAGDGVDPAMSPWVFSSDKSLVMISAEPETITHGYALIKMIHNVIPAIPILLLPSDLKTSDEGEVLYRKMRLVTDKFLKGTIGLGGILLQNQWLHNNEERRDYGGETKTRNAVTRRAVDRIADRLISIQRREMNRPENIFTRVYKNKYVETGDTK